MIINIDNQKEFIKNILFNNMFLGSGAEGTASLVGKRVFKLFYDYKFFKISEKQVITTTDYNLDSFIFPEDLICCKDKCIGYICRYIPNDILPENGRQLVKKDIYNLLKAREKMLKDAEQLSKDKIAISDLASNILFDGTNLAAIDTLNYQKEDSISDEYNSWYIDWSILSALQYKNCLFTIDKQMSFEENIKEYQKVLRR